MPPAGKAPHSPAGAETTKPPNLSVDGLRVAALGQLADIARADEGSRDGSFRGWAYVTRELARQDGRRVVAAPTPKNPYHEEIHLPEKVAGNKGRAETARHSLGRQRPLVRGAVIAPAPRYGRSSWSFAIRSTVTPPRRGRESVKLEDPWMPDTDIDEALRKPVRRHK